MDNINVGNQSADHPINSQSPEVTYIPPVKSSNSLVPLFILILLVLLISVIYLYRQNTILKSQLAKSALPTVHNTTPIVPDDTINPTLNPVANWKSYRNETYGFETQYDPQSAPNEIAGNTDVGQFTYLFMIKFGTNPIKFPHGYELAVNQGKTNADYRLELVGHITDRIDSESEITRNGISWTKLNYQIFLTTDYVPITTAFINWGKYGYAITASTLDIDQILSTFKFTK